jgi:hypothetical protein
MNNEERENAKRILLAGRFEIMRADGSTFQTDDIEQFNKAREYGLQALDLQAVFERDFFPTSFEVDQLQQHRKNTGTRNRTNEEFEAENSRY